MEKEWFVYILECRDGTYYTGITDDICRRLAVHNAGKGAKYTRSRRPVTLRYQVRCPNKSQALRRELQIKKLTHTEKEKLFS